MTTPTTKAAGKASLDPLVRRRLAESVAQGIGRLLGQGYENRDGAWWLCVGGEPKRPLRPDEVQWHIERNHAPFVAGGYDKDDPRWWDDPPNMEGQSLGPR
jgi:hypothetical protein